MNTNNLEQGATPEQIPDTVGPKQSRIITKILAPAVRLWLRSQVQQASDLTVEILGSDRQILTGHIPSVAISAYQAIYQGLHLSQVGLIGKSIRINIRAVLRGQPLRLLEPVPVNVELLLRESDLNASLSAPLLSTALMDLLSILLPASNPVDGPVNWYQLSIDSGYLTLSGMLMTDNPRPIGLRTGLRLVSCCELQLEQPQIQGYLGLDWKDLASCQLDLGSEVDVQELTLSLGQVVFRGRININP